MSSKIGENNYERELQNTQKSVQESLDSNYKIVKTVLKIFLLIGATLIIASFTPAAISLSSKLFGIGIGVIGFSTIFLYIAKSKYSKATYENDMNATMFSQANFLNGS